MSATFVCDTGDDCSGCDAAQFSSFIDGGLTKEQSTAICSTIGDVSFNLATGIDTAFVTICAAMVFIMHAGFAMLCAGAIRSKNTMNILLQTVLDAAVSAVAFYLFGYAFAYGGAGGVEGADYATDANPFIGTSLFALSKYKTQNAGNSIQTNELTGESYIANNWYSWVFQWAFAATATTIPAGCVAERFNFNAYLGYSFFISAWIYPVIVHWVWSGPGWLGYTYSNPMFGSGYIDFAGSSVVHMTGGFCGMWGAILAGPRMGRFDSNGQPVDMPGHSASLVVLGTCLLWFGWYGFNPGSVLSVSSAASAEIVGRAAVTTTLSGAAGGVTGLIISFIRHQAWDLLAVCNGVLVGFVSITAGAHVLEPWAALIAGIVGDIIFECTCWLWLKLKIDDPLCASPMHGVVGAWACIWVGCVAKSEYVWAVYGREPYGPYGCFYPTYQGGQGGQLLAAQIVGVLVIFAWITVNIVPFLLIFKFFGVLRISAEEEQAGLDVSKHGGSAYNLEDGKGDKSAQV